MWEKPCAELLARQSVSFREDAEATCEVSQLCAGLKCSIEGAIHLAHDLLQDYEYGMLLIDARNAFNSINRLSLFWNVRAL